MPAALDRGPADQVLGVQRDRRRVQLGRRPDQAAGDQVGGRDDGDVAGDLDDAVRLERVVGDAADQLDGLLRAQAHQRQPAFDLEHEVRAGPRRAGLGDGLDGLGGDGGRAELRRPRRRAGLDGQGDAFGGGPQTGAELGDDPVLPQVQQLVGVADPGLRLPGDEVDRLGEAGAFERVQLAAQALLGALDGRAHRLGDRLAALGEQGDDVVVDADDLAGDAVGAHLHGDAEVAEPLGEDAVGDGGVGVPLVAQVDGVQRPDLPVVVAGPVQDDVVDVQLRVVRPGRVLEEAGDRQVRCGNPVDRPGLRGTGPGRRQRRRELHRRGVGLEDGALDALADRPEPRGSIEVAGSSRLDLDPPGGGVRDRHGLRDRERQVHPGHARPGRSSGLGLDLLDPLRQSVRLVRERLLDPRLDRPELHRRPADRRPVRRLELLEHPLHHRGATSPGQAQLLGSRPLHRPGGSPFSLSRCSTRFRAPGARRGRPRRRRCSTRHRPPKQC